MMVKMWTKGNAYLHWWWNGKWSLKRSFAISYTYQMIQRFYLLDIYLKEIRRYINKNKFPCESLWCGKLLISQACLEQLKDSSVGQWIHIKWTITQVIKRNGPYWLTHQQEWISCVIIIERRMRKNTTAAFPYSIYRLTHKSKTPQARLS